MILCGGLGLIVAVVCLCCLFTVISLVCDLSWWLLLVESLLEFVLWLLY